MPDSPDNNGQASVLMSPEDCQEMLRLMRAIVGSVERASEELDIVSNNARSNLEQLEAMFADNGIDV